MDLKIKDIVDQLQVSEKTVYRWIKEKKIPCYRINHQYRFNRSEINEWILSNKIELASNVLSVASSSQPTNFRQLVQAGGIYADVAGNSVREVLQNAIYTISTPTHISKEEIISALLSREEMMTTAIGKGISIPHPRNPIITGDENASISICYLKNLTDFQSLDGELVHTLFIVLTNNPRRHLEVLSKISFLCQMDSFIEMLKKKTPKDELLTFVQSKEPEWQK
ncbi:MAG: PTS sugar transporter subunit IIA [Ignavibacteriales bacterium]|nr:PTS sugar transporter subunit IIA [Ignavibacteriales bacterium]